MSASTTAAYFWDGLVLHIGGGAPSAPHSHPLLQIALSLSGAIAVKGGKENWRRSESILVGANTEHTFRAENFALLWIDPESDVARRLGQAHTSKQAITLIPSNQITGVRELGELLVRSRGDCDIAHRFCRAVIHSWVQDLPRPGAVHPAVGKALRVIEDEALFKVSASELANRVNLSESRFLHAFRQTTGVPFRRYLMWKRVRHAVFLLVSGRSATQAAITAGFTDGAHLNRVCRMILGVQPRELQAANIELYPCSKPPPLG